MNNPEEKKSSRIRQFYQIMNRRERVGFWSLSSFNFLLFFIMAFLAGASFLSVLFMFLLTQVVIIAYYIYANSLPRKSKTREWTDAIGFAVVAATIIRGGLLEAYTIPTSSMEKSLLVGDFLFVSKINYGPRIPMTPLAIPFVHHTIPGTQLKSYSDAIQMPFFRLPGFSKIKNNDVVVFNYPAENDRPVDKKENYIKRCIGIPGDSLQVIDGQVFLNGKVNVNPPMMQTRHHVKSSDPNGFSPIILREMDITEGGLVSNQGDYEMLVTGESKAKLKALSNVQVVEPVLQKKGEFADYIFPYRKELAWNVDNYGPIYLPRAGDVIQLDPINYWIYERAIRVYEHNSSLELKDGKIYLEGKEINSYQFKMNYYFMMGDNRHNSADSRFWGFVPEDHIVGKAVFVWMSWDSSQKGFFKKIRWNRLFSFID